MKFFSELGSCYRPAVEPSPVAEESGTNVSSSSRRDRKRVRKLSGSASGAHSWTPGLEMIREDGAVVGLERTKEREERPEEKSRGRFMTNRKRSDERFREPKIPMMIPSFTATPFMF